MDRYQVFIASSTESADIPVAIAASLQNIAPNQLDIQLWNEQFQLSKSYMESLEEVATQTDFAIFVFSSDDWLISRGKESGSPRDNVVFELGLFSGKLSRERCFIFAGRKGTTALKIPSDLLGIEMVEFTMPLDDNGKAKIERGCRKVFAQIQKHQKFFRLNEDLFDLLEFREKIVGYWWEKIASAEESGISFLKISKDNALNLVIMTGTAYYENGTIAAYWNTKLVSLHPKGQKLEYFYVGEKPLEANIPFSGFGEMKFHGDPVATISYTKAHGHFFDINEFNLTKTIIKTVRLKKEDDVNNIACMENENEAKQSALAIKIFSQW